MTDRWGTITTVRSQNVSLHRRSTYASSPSRKVSEKQLPQISSTNGVDIQSFSKFVTVGSPQLKQHTSSRTALILGEASFTPSGETGNTPRNNNSTSPSYVSGEDKMSKKSFVTPSLKERSFFFAGPKRFEENENLNYFDSSPINPLVDARRKQGENHSNGLFDRIYEKKPQLFDSMKLQMSNDQLVPSYEKFKEMEEVRQNQVLFHQWREDHQGKSRAFKIAKSGYRSGVTKVDGPIQAATDVYKQQHELLFRIEAEEQSRRQTRLSFIEKYVATNPTVIKTAGGRQKFSLGDIQSTENVFFDRKAKNEEALNSNRQSFDRLFGPTPKAQQSPTAIERSKNLYSHEILGKPQNIISNTLNTNIKYLQ